MIFKKKKHKKEKHLQSMVNYFHKDLVQGINTFSGENTLLAYS